MTEGKENTKGRTRKQARRGDGSIYWDEANGCYVGSISLGYKPDGSRLRPSVRGATMKEVRAKLKELKEDYDDGIELGDKYAVEQAARDWLERKLSGRAPATIERKTTEVEKYIIPRLGKAKLKRLTPDDVDDFMVSLTKKGLRTPTITMILGTLRRIIRHAESRNKVRRNVAMLVDAPEGKESRQSKSLTLDQAKAVLKASQGKWIHAYIALSIFTGVRTEESRPLKWENTHLNPVKDETCSCGRVHPENLPPHVVVWRSVRKRGETKTLKSRRTVGLPDFIVEILTAYQVEQRKRRERNGYKSEGIVYVFGTRYDTVMEARNVRRFFRSVTELAGIPGEWTTRELRHTFVSLMSDQGASDELIADLVGHAKTSTTRTVYRHQLRPVITTGAELLDKAFGKGFLDEG
ncbi:tyrosine-type recombinase/integrase [Glycomyces buryatensis]|uniref:Site-specific integrase n=1 Tax=Glycomyces buryatensis TaxID=2570927 RepID=A0A4S8QF69_9ACTN|nr:site-specific integrase [Glycomyces buryatensis]THV41772.1 site-specific integrase [Glycomyces buryatensis]